MIPSHKYKHCNHHHELTDEHEIVDFGDGEFVANKAAIPLLKALNEIGLRTRSHHIDRPGHGWFSILLDNVTFKVQVVDEIHADRTKYNGKQELMIFWGEAAALGTVSKNPIESYLNILQETFNMNYDRILFDFIHSIREIENYEDTVYVVNQPSDDHDNIFYRCFIKGGIQFEVCKSRVVAEVDPTSEWAYRCDVIWGGPYEAESAKNILTTLMMMGIGPFRIDKEELIITPVNTRNNSPK